MCTTARLGYVEVRHPPRSRARQQHGGAVGGLDLGISAQEAQIGPPRLIWAYQPLPRSGHGGQHVPTMIAGLAEKRQPGWRRWRNLISSLSMEAVRHCFTWRRRRWPPREPAMEEEEAGAAASEHTSHGLQGPHIFHWLMLSSAVVLLRRLHKGLRRCPCGGTEFAEAIGLC